MNNMQLYEELSACCGWPIKGGFCSDCHEHAGAGYLYECEEDGCTNEAVSCWEWAENDPYDGVQSYYTNRCMFHPVLEPEWLAVDIFPRKELEANA